MDIMNMEQDPSDHCTVVQPREEPLKREPDEIKESSSSSCDHGLYENVLDNFKQWEIKAQSKEQDPIDDSAVLPREERKADEIGESTSSSHGHGLYDNVLDNLQQREPEQSMEQDQIDEAAAVLPCEPLKPLNQGLDGNAEFNGPTLDHGHREDSSDNCLPCVPPLSRSESEGIEGIEGKEPKNVRLLQNILTELAAKCAVNFEQNPVWHHISSTKLLAFLDDLTEGDKPKN